MFNNKPKFEVYVAMQYTKGEGETIRSYVNNIRTEEGGTHETGFKSGLTKALNKYIKGAKVAKAGKKELTFSGEDFLDGLTVIVSIKMQNVEFEGQTKTKLGSKDVRQAVETIVSREIGLILSSPSNKSLVKMIMEKATNACKVRESGKRAKDLQRHKNGLGAEVLVGKFSSCSGRNAEKNEIFIVEGNSAGGSAKQGRDRSFQAVLPLRGKPLNAEKKSKEQVWKNEEFKALIYALGTDIDKDFNINNLKFGKVIILADADQDGGHISSILLTFFYKYMRELITNGNVYLGMPPLYKIEHKGKTSYVYNDAELQEFLPTIKGKYTLQRYKGLGEMNPEQLWETTLNPATRVLTQVVIDDSDKAREMVKTFMGSNTQDRKEYISNNASFGKVADAEIEEE